MSDKIKVLGFMTCHYGGAFLREALESVVDHVDKFVVAYSVQPSQGHGTHMKCPDSEGYIFDICQDVLKDKFIWDRAERYGAEHEHRAVRYKYADGYDLILTVDSDEVYASEQLPASFEYAMNGEAQLYGIDGYINFWKSFERVCYDGYRPIRLEQVRNKSGVQDLNLKQTIYHFSTCQPKAIMDYKFLAFGHAHEVRKDWLQDVYYGWTDETRWLHCVSEQIWEKAEPFDKTTLPEILKKHWLYGKLYCAVIVENRLTNELFDAILDHRRHLPDSWSYCHIDDPKIKTMADYNALLTSKEFWQKFEKFDRVLIFQHDSKLLRTGIEEFLEWDYVGAPWKFQEHGGNGGLSIRNPRTMIEIIERCPYDGIN
jgi:hypothetical protein